MSIVYEEYAPEVGRRPNIAVGGRPNIAVGGRRGNKYGVPVSVEMAHNTFFMTADELMKFYAKMRIIRRDRAHVGR